MKVTEAGTPVKLTGAWNGSTGMSMGELTGQGAGLVQVHLSTSRRVGYFEGEHVAVKPGDLEVLEAAIVVGASAATPPSCATGREARLEEALEGAWHALKWKRLNPLDQIDEARDIIDDALGRPRPGAKGGRPMSRIDQLEAEPYPPPSESPYGERRAVWSDTGEHFKVLTIDGEPVGVAPNGYSLEQWAKSNHLAVVSDEMVREMRGNLLPAARWRRFAEGGLLGRLWAAFRANWKETYPW